MKNSFTINRKAMSTLTYIILLLTSFTVGAVFSYMFTIASYINLPRNTNTLVITNAAFPPENAKYFNFTILNPSYSPDPKVTITRIAIQPEKENKLYNVTDTEPELPHETKRGTSQIFRCKKNWGEFAGQNITIHVFATEASGGTYSVATSPVKLEVKKAVFDPSISVKQFNVTVQNSPKSAITLNITEILAIPPIENVTPSLLNSYPLAPGENISFTCKWNWTQVVEATITIETLQGYKAKYGTGELHKAIITISDVYFNKVDTDHFNVTVWNQPESPESTHYVNITRTAVIAANGTQLHQIETNVNVNQNSSVTFRCPWEWRDYRNKNVTITVYTKQGFVCSYKTVTPPSVILEIVDTPYFNLSDTSHFNVTLQNSPYSLRTANITKIAVATNETTKTIIPKNDTVPKLINPYSLEKNSSQSWNCPWNWGHSMYKGKNVTITMYYYDVKTLEKFDVSYTLRIPHVKLEIPKVEFNSSTPWYFNVTVYDEAVLYNNVTITKIVVALKNGTICKVFEKGEAVVNWNDTWLTLPFALPANASATFICPWSWLDYSSKSVTIIVYISEGFTASFPYEIP
ncbi:MAG: hypothetical protein U9O89_00850 [Thermoproteota archaeon]|nr:hypothetical protein [Thermoproteota archaeon]